LENIDKILNAAIIAFFYIIGEKTGRQLAHFPVIMQTITASALAGTRSIAAITHRHILFTFTLCQLLPLFVRPLQNNISQLTL